MTYLVALRADSGTGKDTQAALLQTRDSSYHLKFAMGLRAVVYAELGLNPYKMGDKDYEKDYIQDCLIEVSKDYLQKYGLNLWVSFLVQRMWSLSFQTPVVVSDLRQPHEAQPIHLMGGQVIQLNRPNPSRPLAALDRLLPEDMIDYKIELQPKHRHTAVPVEKKPWRVPEELYLESDFLWKSFLSDCSFSSRVQENLEIYEWILNPSFCSSPF